MKTILILCGKTASGKDTIRKELLKKGLDPVISYTTRPIRKNEKNGIDYNFISKQEFINKEKQGFFVETTSYKVSTGDTWYYGSAINDMGDNKVMIANPDGISQIQKIKSLNPVVFYILSNEETILNRLIQRGDDPKESRRRLNTDNIDFSNIDENIDFAFRNDLKIKPHILADLIWNTYVIVQKERGVMV